MLFIERNAEGGIIALRRGEQQPGREQASLLDEEVLAFLKTGGEIETLAQLLMYSDASIVRVLEDLIDLLIEKKVILFTELPTEAQDKIRERKQLRAKMVDDPLLVDDIL